MKNFLTTILLSLSLTGFAQTETFLWPIKNAKTFGLQTAWKNPEPIKLKTFLTTEEAGYYLNEIERSTSQKNRKWYIYFAIFCFVSVVCSLIHVSKKRK